MIAVEAVLSYDQLVTELLSLDNMRSIVNGLADMPIIYNNGTTLIKSSAPEGSFKTPGFQALTGVSLSREKLRVEREISLSISKI